MALFVNEMPGPRRHQPQVVDLDEGTTLPRIVSIAGVVLVIAGILFLLATSQDGVQAGSSSNVSSVVPKSVTVPAMRAMSAQMPSFDGSVPADDIGPTSYRIGVDSLAMRVVMSEFLSR
ncbi:MAG TPA: hypothetical protein VD789_13115 [Thermomicrobiales bacterium]|nr:hypothetical protein [Thermomicrobiales bacterium]